MKTWEQFKSEKQKQFGTALESIETEIIKIIPRYEEPKPEPPTPRFNIHKRSLPVGIDKVVVYSVTKTEAEWWLEHKLQARVYHDQPRDTKTLIYYDIVPVNATPRERSVYFNPRPAVLGDDK